MPEKETISERLKQVIFLLKKYKLITSQQQLGEMLGYSHKTYVSQIVNGFVSNNEFIIKLTETFPLISYDWIKTGLGKPIKEEYITSNRDSLLNNYLGNPSEDDTLFDTTEPKDETPQEEIPVAIPIVPPSVVDKPNTSLYADLKKNASDYEKLNLLQIIQNVDVAYRVMSEKLAPHINIGDIIFLKRLEEEQEVRNGDPYFIDTTHLGGLLRYTYDEGDNFRLVATNRIPECTINKSKVIDIYQIVGKYTSVISMPDYLSNKQIRQQGKHITSLVESVNNLVNATIDEGRRTDVVLSMLKDELNKNK